MADFLGVDLAAIIDDTFTSLGLQDSEAAVVSLGKVTAGARTVGAESSGQNPTTTSYPIRGFLAAYSQFYVDGTSIIATDRRGVIWGNSVPSGVVIVPNDRIVDANGKSWRVVTADLDPAGAVWKCQLR